MKYFNLFLLVLCSAVHAFSQRIPSPKAGDKAPQIYIDQWVKGDSITHFEKGKTYVIEFTATWCGPCIKAIPHLNEMAKQYKDKINFLSVYCRYSGKMTEQQEMINSIYAKQDKNLALNVCMDNASQQTADAWGITGVPTCFVVDTNGVIAWARKGIQGLDSTLKQIVSGTFNKEQTVRDQNAYDLLIKRLETQAKTDYQSAVNSIDSLLVLHPEYIALYHIKFKMLAGRDDKRANAWMKWMFRKGPQGLIWTRLSSAAWMDPKQPDYKLALKAIDRATKDIAKDPEYWNYHFKMNMYSSKSRQATNRSEKKQALKKTIFYCDKALAYALKYRLEESNETKQFNLRVKKQYTELL